MPQKPPTLETRVLLRGLAMPESARWHEDRLWFAHWGANEIVAADMKGQTETIEYKPPHAFGWSFDWLPDGSLVATGKELMRRKHDGSWVRHIDLTGIAKLGWNEIVVDGRGNTYVNSINFSFLAGEKPRGGLIALVTPEGKARQVAGDIAFPNGMVVTPDNSKLIVSESLTGRLLAFDIAKDGGLSNKRIWAEHLGPDGIKMDSEGAIWVQAGDVKAATHRADSPEGAVVRVLEGGRVLERIEHNKDIFAVTLGGPDGKTLFMLATEFRGADKVMEVAEARVGEVLVADAPAPGAGWP